MLENTGFLLRLSSIIAKGIELTLTNQIRLKRRPS
uniref:Uncharacterized protein n=1 Tax=Anguilla anguilla TaxID=7936 RepID=A0A0E9UGM6_ANGAN